jgi:hypothetical protein
MTQAIAMALNDKLAATEEDALVEKRLARLMDMANAIACGLRLSKRRLTSTPNSMTWTGSRSNVEPKSLWRVRDFRIYAIAICVINIGATEFKLNSP